MSESNETGTVSWRQNPLIWIALVVIGLIIIVFVSGDRGQSKVSAPSETKPQQSQDLPVTDEQIENSVGEIQRNRRSSRRKHHPDAKRGIHPQPGQPARVQSRA